MRSKFQWFHRVTLSHDRCFPQKQCVTQHMRLILVSCDVYRWNLGNSLSEHSLIQQYVINITSRLFCKNTCIRFKGNNKLWVWSVYGFIIFLYIKMMLVKILLVKVESKQEFKLRRKKGNNVEYKPTKCDPTCYALQTKVRSNEWFYRTINVCKCRNTQCLITAYMCQLWLHK